MKLEGELAAAVAASANAPIAPETARKAVGLLDLTSLNDDDTDARIEALCAKAVTPAGPVAAVCVYPRFVAPARRRLAGSPVRIATVVNFPAGGTDAGVTAAETVEAVAAGADEIDLVMPWRALLAGDEAAVRAVLADCRAACRGSLLKVIIESGGLATAEAVRRASALAIEGGADFLKTSTGKLDPAATPEAAALMLGAIRGAGRPIGFKAAGGIRDAATAARYLDLADRLMGPDWVRPGTFRFGASGLLDSLLGTLGTPSGAPAPTAGY